MERYIKKCIRLKKSINDKINIICEESSNSYSYQTLEYLLELGILKYEELKLKDSMESEIISKLDDVKILLEKIINNE